MEKGEKNELKSGYHSPLLPGHLEEISYKSALEFDKYTGMGADSDAALKSKVMTHGGTLMDQLFTLHLKDVLSIGWPTSLYIPGVQIGKITGSFPLRQRTVTHKAGHPRLHQRELELRRLPKEHFSIFSKS